MSSATQSKQDAKHDELVELVRQHIGDFPDFPKPGILFRDIFTALRSGPVCRALRTLLVEHVRAQHPDVQVVVGLEARGFLFCFAIASELGCATVPIRKRGKLPGQCVQHEYQLEYGCDAFEMQSDAIAAGQRVVIVDDLLATGGTLEAAVKLVRSTGAIVSGCVVVMELADLNGRQKIDAPVHSFIKYD